MRCHDFRLEGYSVSDLGSKITLHLVYDYHGAERAESHIEFHGVEFYHFLHTQGAIIIDIEEEPLTSVIKTEEALLTSVDMQLGVRMWQTGPMDYLRNLTTKGCHTWRIQSAIGFTGFIIAQSIAEARKSTPV